MILQCFENPKRNTQRDVNTLGGNTLRLLREVCNFVLFRNHGCVVQRSLNENININFCFILLPQKLLVVLEQTTLNHGFCIVICISMFAEIYFLYAMIDICDMLIVFIRRTTKICAVIDICDMLIVWFRFIFCILDYI